MIEKFDFFCLKNYSSTAKETSEHLIGKILDIFDGRRLIDYLWRRADLRFVTLVDEKYNPAIEFSSKQLRIDVNTMGPKVPSEIGNTYKYAVISHTDF